MTGAGEAIARLKVTLDDVEPPVTRRLAVPLGIRLDRLHLTLQAALGWTDSHLWEIRARDVAWGIPDPGWPDGPLSARKATLWDVIEDTGAKTLHYLYDFGDGWEHTVKHLGIDDGEPGTAYPVLLDAKGHCPPEDIGGFPGYELFLEAMADPNHPEHDEMTEWYGDTFNPNQPPTDELKLEVLKLAKKWKPKKPRG